MRFQHRHVTVAFPAFKTCTHTFRTMMLLMYLPEQHAFFLNIWTIILPAYIRRGKKCSSSYLFQAQESSFRVASYWVEENAVVLYCFNQLLQNLRVLFRSQHNYYKIDTGPRTPTLNRSSYLPNPCVRYVFCFVKRITKC